MIFNENGITELSTNLKNTSFEFIDDLMIYIDNVLSFDVLNKTNSNKLVKISNSVYPTINQLKSISIGKNISPVINRNLLIEGKPSNLDVKEYLSYSLRYTSMIISIADFFINEKSKSTSSILSDKSKDDILKFKNKCKENNDINDALKFMKVLLNFKKFKTELSNFKNSINASKYKNSKKKK